jgi:hypothetical protein
MSQFIYFVCVHGNKDILRKEIEFRFPDLTPSFAQKDFLTFKNTGTELSPKEIKGMRPAYALSWGESVGELSKDIVEEKLKVQDIDFELPEKSPSRNYLKIAQACKRFDIKPNKKKNWIEFGSAPGGASLYLLENFGKVTGVDPAVMEDICLDNSNFNHLCKPIQDLSQEELPDHDIHYISSDLNINPKQGVKELIRLSKKYHTIEGVFYSIKFIKDSQLKEMTNFIGAFEAMAYKRVGFMQLSSHKRETLLFAFKN